MAPPFGEWVGMVKLYTRLTRSAARGGAIAQEHLPNADCADLANFAVSVKKKSAPSAQSA
jgi:hypothetical protein